MIPGVQRFRPGARASTRVFPPVPCRPSAARPGSGNWPAVRSGSVCSRCDPMASSSAGRTSVVTLGCDWTWRRTAWPGRRRSRRGIASSVTCSSATATERRGCGRVRASLAMVKASPASLFTLPGRRPAMRRMAGPGRYPTAIPSDWATASGMPPTVAGCSTTNGNRPCRPSDWMAVLIPILVVAPSRRQGHRVVVCPAGIDADEDVDGFMVVEQNAPPAAGHLPRHDRMASCPCGAGSRHPRCDQPELRFLVPARPHGNFPRAYRIRVKAPAMIRT